MLNYDMFEDTVNKSRQLKMPKNKKNLISFSLILIEIDIFSFPQRPGLLVSMIHNAKSK